MANEGCSEHISNYVPDPRETFLLENKYTVCTICHEAKLRPVPREKGDRKPGEGEFGSPTLLPCGHVFCFDCLANWLDSGNLNCPKCRLSLTRELCEHPLLPYNLTADDVFGAPKTIPKGGTIHGQCPPCRKLTDQRVAYELYQALCKDLMEAPEDQKEAKRQHMDDVVRSLVGDQPQVW
ncbi:hypothetical protein QBC34DRAFT_393111 [Podospora aff. communis PSN243]|uniref:RING-type domain-containing protein n=1 Tax=Podospora aff. communis PSN243 TaxID=3040156 RepID=A0AAV9H149_9PEZI|nr:hypothetical protein QBC34DRAFT_393111 [Podospora aff. communis PSN243]